MKIDGLAFFGLGDQVSSAEGSGIWSGVVLECPGFISVNDFLLLFWLDFGTLEDILAHLYASLLSLII